MSLQIVAGTGAWVCDGSGNSSAYPHDYDPHDYEAGQTGPDPVFAFILAMASLLIFCFVWYKTNKW